VCRASENLLETLGSRPKVGRASEGGAGLTHFSLYEKRIFIY